ncbi:MAG: 3-keto-5-aminohexanoate cleavage protein [Rhizobiales bacterium]|nr:3-keto-5-aminohexanoate cleavage protein [Hyphomicrobiales bacterium]
MNDLAIITCAITGVLTDPKQHPVPVTPEELAREAKIARDAGASVIHVHFRRQEDGKGHLPSWDPKVAADCVSAIRAAVPGIVINQTTGVVGAEVGGPLDCIRATRPEIAACNAGSLNYLKVKSDGGWAWPPILFDNPVDKVGKFLDVMKECNTRPEFECFDTGIVRSVGMYRKAKMYEGRLQYNFVMGVESGMPVEPELLPLLTRLAEDDAMWSVTAIGRENIWPLHRRAAELGGQLRTGVEDTFYLPDGKKTNSNGPLIETLAQYAREAGRKIASPDEARRLLGLS